MKLLNSLLLIFLLTSFGLSQNQKDLTTANTRATKAAEVLKQFAALGADSIPFEYLQKAKAVAVFPGLTKVNILLNELIIGNGIVSLRSGNDWSVPAFLAFKGQDINFKFAGKKSFDTVILFMDDESIGWLKKGDIAFNSNKKRIVALGPVIGGKETDKTAEKANLVYYTFEKGQLIDTDLRNNSIFRAFAIFHDNNLNKSIFGMKTKALFAAPESSVKVPSEIDKFRSTLIEVLSNRAAQSAAETIKK